MLEKEQFVQFVEILKSKKEALHAYLEDQYAESFDIDEIEEVNKEVNDYVFSHLDVNFYIISIEDANEILDDLIDGEIKSDIEGLPDYVISNLNFEGMKDSLQKIYSFYDIFDGIVYKDEDYLIMEE